MAKVRTTSPVARRDGLHIDPGQLDHQLALRGITVRTLAERAGIPEVTLSRARHGRRIRESTLRKLTAALLEIPRLPGAELLISEPGAVSGKSKR